MLPVPLENTELTKCLAGIPRTLKIGAYDWKIIFEDNDEELLGQAVFETGTIRLWPKNMTGPDKVVGILLHEALHVIFDNHGLGHLKRDKEEREEQIVLGFEAGLISLLRDNPKLLVWIKRWLGKKADVAGPVPQLTMA